MSDINEELRNAVTAREDASSVIGHKRGRAAPDATQTPQATLTKRSKTAMGLDMQALQHDFAAERAREGERIRKSYRTDTQLSAEAASNMAFRLLEYVMKEQLGGRHNAVTEVPASTTSHNTGATVTARLAVERASLRAIAALDVSYICTGIASIDDAWVGLRKETPAAAPVLAYRKTLRPCDMHIDLIGGLTSALPPHSRQHWQRTVEAALRGECLPMKDEPALSTHSATASTSHDVSEMPMDLFTEPQGAACSGAKQDDLENTKPLFSVADFLNTTNSSSDDDDD